MYRHIGQNLGTYRHIGQKSRSVPARRSRISVRTGISVHNSVRTGISVKNLGQYLHICQQFGYVPAYRSITRYVPAYRSKISVRTGISVQASVIFVPVTLYLYPLHCHMNFPCSLPISYSAGPSVSCHIAPMCCGILYVLVSIWITFRSRGCCVPVCLSNKWLYQASDTVSCSELAGAVCVRASCSSFLFALTRNGKDLNCVLPGARSATYTVLVYRV